MKKPLLALLLLINLNSITAFSTEFSTTGAITSNAPTASLIVTPYPNGYSYSDTQSSDDGAWNVIFGSGYNTTTYRSFYSLTNLQPYYNSPLPSYTLASFNGSTYAPYNFIDASSIPAGNFASRSYNVYNLAIRGSGTYIFRVTDPGFAVNYVRLTDNSSNYPYTIDLVAALYAKTGNYTTAFNSSSSTQNLVSLSDDNSPNGGSNPYPMFYQNTSTSDCITMSLVYFSWNGSLSLPANVNISASGPGQIASACSGLGPSPSDTQLSLQNSASKLKAAYNLQTALITTGLNYDCNLFDKNGICLSGGGRYSDGKGNASALGALLIAAYRLNDNLRLGGYLDENLHHSLPTGLEINNNGPMAGLFAVWQQNSIDNGWSAIQTPNGEGWGAKFALGYSDKDIKLTRSVFGTSEPGSGKSSLTSKAAMFEINYSKLHFDKWMVTPYAGIQYSKVNRQSYSEQSNLDVTSALSYPSLAQEQISLKTGVRVLSQLATKWFGFSDIGLEQDLNYRGGSYSATGVDGIYSFDFSSDINRTRPYLSLGTAYAPEINQRLSLNLLYKKEAITSGNTYSAFATYSVGF